MQFLHYAKRAHEKLPFFHHVPSLIHHFLYDVGCKSPQLLIHIDCLSFLCIFLHIFLMLRMQKHVSFVRHRCLKVLFVHLNDIWILMRESKVRIAIQIIQVLSTFKRAFFAVMDRLSATTDASSRTCHNFYKVMCISTDSILRINSLVFPSPLTTAVLTVISLIWKFAS